MTLHRMAIGPANVLISDPSADWMKIAVPLVLQQDLMSSQYTSPAMVTDETAAGQVGAQDILRLKLEDRQGKTHIGATVVDAKTQKTTAAEDVDASSMGNLIPTLDRLAKKLDPTAGEFSTKNVDALRLLATAGTEQHPQERAEILKKTVAADPNFGMAYFLLLQMLAAGGPDVYKDTLAQANSHMANFPPYERARFQLLQGQITRAPLSQRAAAVEALHKIAPNDLEALSMLGSLRFLNGDANGGAELLNKAVQLNPGNAQLKAQLAEGLVQNKRFAEAEKVLAAFDKDPAALAELACTILLQGDVKRATAAAEKLMALSQQPDYQALLRASWSELAGDRAKAVSLAESTKFSKPEMRGMAMSEATVWLLMNKDFAGAKKMAELGVKSNDHPTAITIVSALLVSGDQSAAQWRSKVEASPINPAMKATILAYGFFLNGHYPEAVDEWRKAYVGTEGTDLRVRAMLAASLNRAGNTAEAEKIKVLPFVIRDFADVYGAVAFTEMRRLTGLTH